MTPISRTSRVHSDYPIQPVEAIRSTDAHTPSEGDSRHRRDQHTAIAARAAEPDPLAVGLNIVVDWCIASMGGLASILGLKKPAAVAVTIPPARYHRVSAQKPADLFISVPPAKPESTTPHVPRGEVMTLDQLRAQCRLPFKERL